MISEKFLLECNTTSVRWQAHALVVSLYNNSAPAARHCLLAILWSLWRRLPEHGRRTAQFVDLLGYFSVSECWAGNKDTIAKYAWVAVEMLRSQNTILGLHAVNTIYTCLSQLGDFTGYYLESDPCLVCQNPEVSFTNLKLSSLKVDTKFSTHTQMVKLSGSHSIFKNWYLKRHYEKDQMLLSDRFLDFFMVPTQVTVICLLWFFVRLK